MPFDVHSLACFIKTKVQTNEIVIYGGFLSDGSLNGDLNRLDLQDLAAGWENFATKVPIAGIGSSMSAFQLPITSETMDTNVFGSKFVLDTTLGTKVFKQMIVGSHDRLINSTENGYYEHKLQMIQGGSRVSESMSQFG